MPAKQKLYCYVDESGQDTKGRLFIVAIVIGNRENRDKLEKKLEEIEATSGKSKKKWQKTKYLQRISYLEKITDLTELKHNLFTAHFETTKEYESLTTYTIAQSVNSITEDDYRVTVVIDGLSATARQRVMRELRRLRIKYNKVIGARDQTSSILRLADALAGLARDWWEKDKYAKKWHKKLLTKGLLTDLH